METGEGKVRPQMSETETSENGNFRLFSELSDSRFKIERHGFSFKMSDSKMSDTLLVLK
jgi:hypothetical protein